MDGRKTWMSVVFLLCVFTGRPAEGQSVLDVCASCHVNATCDDKVDGSGKVCNCKYGFVGNGRSFCQDKDECQIGATRICGQHTTCHNTYGSYYCTCLAGYSPSNNMAVFIPNDGTHCQDIDECRLAGLCGEGSRCRNLDGSFDCSCQVGYKVHNGVEPFHPMTDRASCKVVDCGQPVPVEDAVLLSLTGTTFSGEASFVCDEGFVWRGGDNSSVCGADGLWRGPSMVCEEVDCGSPPALPHAHLLWSKGSRMGAQALYQCHVGYRNAGEGNVSVCTAAGRWATPPLLCQEILCGNPPLIKSAEQVWDNGTAPGSTVLYRCNEGFKNTGGSDLSVCNGNGQWTLPTLSCQEVSCGDPPALRDARLLWDGRSTPGSTLTYICKTGFYHSQGGNVSVCTASGSWTESDISCRAVDCGEPSPVWNSVRIWDGTSSVGSEVVYQCVPGYLNVGEGNVSVCAPSGEWEGASVLCQEKKPPITNLSVFNEKCLQWNAEKYKEDTEIYKVIYSGSRDYQRSFHDKRKRHLSSKDERLEVCLNLLPVTNYSISITATSSRFTATITTNTSLPAPPAPAVYYREFETPLPTLRLHRSPNTLDSLSFYQVFVIPVEGIMTFDCSSPVSSDPSEYITAQLDLRNVGTTMNFTVGDGRHYGGVYNTPLESGKSYHIILRAVCQWKTALKSSCVLWAKVRGTSYALRVSSLCAAAFVTLATLIVLGAYSFIWCVKKTGQI